MKYTFLTTINISLHNSYYLCDFSSGRNGFTKNVAARNPIPITEWTAMVNGLDLIGPRV